MEAESKLMQVAAIERREMSPSKPAARERSPKKRAVRKDSPKGLAANRRNAWRSTGPRTPEGKAVVRWNALKHGLLAKEIVVRAGESPENPDDFHHLLAQLREYFRPASIVEEVLVEKIAACYWRMARVLRAEAGEIRKAQDGVPEARMRDLQMQELLRVAVETTPEGEERRLESERACCALPGPADVERILRYETTMERQLYRALHHLERIQRRRNGEAVPPPVSIEFAGV